METYFDTAKMRECGNNMNILIDSLKNTYDELFNRFENMNKTTGEWVGDSAERFILATRIEKKEYLDYISDLKEYANYLIENSDYIDSKLNDLRR